MPKRSVVPAAVAAAILAWAPLPARAADEGAGRYGADFEACQAEDTTIGISQCLSERHRDWDARLNAAYETAMASVEPERQDPLRTAQRAWIAYRDANCAFYASVPGTIRAILAAECLRSMTESRALELEEMIRP